MWDLSAKAFQRNVVDVALRDGICKKRVFYGDREVPQGTISKQTWNAVSDISIWPVYATFRGITSVVHLADLGHFSTARDFVSGGRRFVELLSERTERRGHSRLLVDPDRDFLPVRYEVFDRNGKLLNLITISSRKDSQARWVPQSWETSVYRNTHLIRKVTTQVEQIDIGGSFPDDTFSVDYPPGTYVFDTSGEKPRDLIIREGKAPREILPGERRASFKQLMATEAGDLLNPADMTLWRRHRGAFIASGVALLVAAALFVRYRIRHTLQTR